MKRHITDILIILTLFGAYAVGAMFLSAIGADVYQSTADHMQENFDMRTGALYVAEKVRQNDVSGGIRKGAISGGDALVLIENKSGYGYQTWIYVYDGALCEILVAPGAAIQLANSQAIMPMQNLEVEYAASDLLRVRLTNENGVASDLNLHIRSAGEGV